MHLFNGLYGYLMCFRIVLLMTQKYLSKKFQLTKNSRQCKSESKKIVNNLAALFSFLQGMPLETR